MADTSTAPDLATFEAEARAWLDANAERKKTDDTGEKAVIWGEGEFSVSVFHNLTYAEEKAVIDEAAAWTQKKAEVGYHKISWEPEFGGMGLTKDHEKVFARLESEYITPGGHETHSVTIGLMAPTIRLLGTDQQKKDWVDRWARCEELCCQLFSEPGAGSDLASVAMKADRDGDEWVLNGQKVWSSGAQFSEWGMAVCRSDSDLPKHKGITVFVVPMDAPGCRDPPDPPDERGHLLQRGVLQRRPYPRRVPGRRRRRGLEGRAHRVRVSSAAATAAAVASGGTWAQVKALADHFEAWNDPVLRDDLANLYIRYRLMAMTRQRIAAQVKAGQAPGPEGSIGKVFWTDSMAYMSDVVGRILGPRLTADTGEWGTFEWNDHVLGAPGYRIAGGSDEIQKNIVGRTGARPARRTPCRQEPRLQGRPQVGAAAVRVSGGSRRRAPAAVAPRRRRSSRGCDRAADPTSRRRSRDRRRPCWRCHAAPAGVEVSLPPAAGVTTTSSTHGEWRRSSSSRRSKRRACGSSAPVRTMRRRFDRARGPTVARSVTHHAGPASSVSAAAGSTRLTRSIHSP